MDSIIQISNLKKSFNSQKVLRGVNLNIPRGQITIVIGRSGCGKSVLLKHIIGLLSPDQGHIFLDGQDLIPMNRHQLQNIRMRFGMLFQEAALFDSMNVYDNIAFPLREHRNNNERTIREIVREKLKDVKLDGVEQKMPAELSGGMKKRVGLARALVLNPEIILYDEPTTGLDPITAQSIDDLIIETQGRIQGTSIIISHDIHATLRIANKIAMLHDGVIVAEGTASDIRQSKNSVVQAFLYPEQKSSENS